MALASSSNSQHPVSSSRHLSAGLTAQRVGPKTPLDPQSQRRRFGSGGDRVRDAGTKLLDLGEVAERLRVSVVTVRWLRQEGRFAPAIKVGRRVMWDVRDVEAWIEE